MSSTVCLKSFQESIKFCIESSIFYSDLKLVDVTPASEKTLKDNYRLTSVLPNTCKIHENVPFQIQTFFDEVLCKYQSEFRNNIMQNTAYWLWQKNEKKMWLMTKGLASL